jgi:glycerophosphoryl diester phosphodiesterase
MLWQEDEKIWSWLPRLQSHRGYWVGGLSQNTIESIKAAYEKGYGISEFDVRLTKDHQIVLFHDREWNGQALIEMTFDELNAKKPVHKLEELFDWFKTTENFKLNIEIKNDKIFNYKVEAGVCALIEKHGLEERVLISSFNPLSLAKVRLFCPRVYRALLLSFEREHGNNFFVMSTGANILCYPHVLHLRELDFKNHVNNFKLLAKKIPLVLWTVNNVKTYEDYKEIIFGVISDEITPEKFKD